RSRSSHSSRLMVPVKYQVATTSMTISTTTAGIRRSTRRRASEPRGISRASRLAGFIDFKQVAEAAHGLNARARAFEPPPQAVDVHLYRVFAEIGIPGRQRIHQLPPGYDPTGAHPHH